MKKPIEVTEAVQTLWDVVLANRIPGEAPQTARELDAKALPSQVLGDGFYLRWERGWGVDAKLSVRSSWEDGRPTLVVTVGWGSSEFSAASARAAARLHADVADMCCWLQSAIDSLPPIKGRKD